MTEGQLGQEGGVRDGSIAKRFGDVGRLNHGGLLEVRDRSGDAQHALEPTRRQREPVDRAREQGAGVGRRLQDRAGETCRQRRVHEARVSVSGGQCRYLDMQVDPVEERPGNLPAIAGDVAWRARAGAAWIAAEAARARVHRADEKEASGKRPRPGHARNGDHSVFERLAQSLEGVPPELGHFSETESIQIIRHACRALSVAHADGIVHRDIKPDNMMLTSHGDVKLVDLGIAKRIDEDQSLTQTGQAIGTPHYISPEQIRGQKDVDPRADVYSLGATLYHLVTGQTPYSGASGPIVMSMHLVEPLPDPRRFETGLSEGICRVIRRMMAKDRDERYGDVYALDLDLYRLRCGEMPQPDEQQGTAIEPQGGMTASPGYVPAAGGEFDSGVLGRIEENLASAVGPMAKVLVRRTARTAPTLEALCGTLAEQIAETAARDKFLAKCLLAARAPGGSSRPGRMTPPPPSEAPTEVVLSEQDLRFLETELAKHVGPLARVLVKKAAKGEGNMSHVITKLELEIDSDDARRAFRAAVKKLR